MFLIGGGGHALAPLEKSDASLWAYSEQESAQKSKQFDMENSGMCQLLDLILPQQQAQC